MSRFGGVPLRTGGYALFASIPVRVLHRGEHNGQRTYSTEQLSNGITNVVYARDLTPVSKDTARYVHESHYKAGMAPKPHGFGSAQSVALAETLDNAGAKKGSWQRVAWMRGWTRGKHKHRGRATGFGLDNDQKLNMGPEYRRWGPINESKFVNNPLDEPRFYNEHFDGLGGQANPLKGWSRTRSIVGPVYHREAQGFFQSIRPTSDGYRLRLSSLQKVKRNHPTYGPYEVPLVSHDYRFHRPGEAAQFADKITLAP